MRPFAENRTDFGLTAKRICDSISFAAGMVEQVDTRDLKSLGVKSVPVRFRLPAPKREHPKGCSLFGAPESNPSKCNSPVDYCLPPAGRWQHINFHSPPGNENANRFRLPKRRKSISVTTRVQIDFVYPRKTLPSLRRESKQRAAGNLPYGSRTLQTAQGVMPLENPQERSMGR